MKLPVVLCFLSFALVLAGCNCAQAVRCTDKQDCVDPLKPYCAPVLGACVECLSDDMCQDGFVCNAEGECEAGCRNERDRCFLGRFCIAGVGCVECTADEQCGAGRVCSMNVCVPGCSVTNPTCPQGLVCDVNSGRCVGCVDHGDCTTPPLALCDPSAQTCVECLTHADCTDPSRPVCDLASHSCVRCVVDANCPAGNVCRNNTCTPGCSSNQPCPQGQVCSPGGQCVQCVSDAQCSGATPRCHSATNTCVACLPGPGDNCPVGQYCRADFVCERGCKTGADCPSGVCLADHSCQGCVDDTQCAAGKVCQNGTCIDMCGPAAACGTSLDCCAGHCKNLQNDVAHCGACGRACATGQACCSAGCVNLQTDNNNCGACGNVCGAGAACCAGQCKPLNTLSNCGACGNACGVDQFCDGQTCRDQTFPEFCANRNVYAIRDGIPLDDAATNMLASTILQYCSSQTNLQYGPQTNPAWVDQTTGALLLGGGSTVVTAGGPFPNKVVKWLERTNRTTKVYFSSNGIDTFYFKKRSDDSVVTSRLASWCNPNRDVFIVELVTDPTSATLALIAYGLCSPGNGTQTGAWYWANVMLPNRASYPDSWYLYEWLDTNMNSLPDMTDTFTVIASGR
jgi:Cys-rich repeat protein